MKGSDFIFGSVKLIYYICHKGHFKRLGSYIDSPDWIKKKNATVAWNNEKINWNPERVSNIKPFIKKHNWKKIKFSSKINYWKKVWKK